MLKYDESTLNPSVHYIKRKYFYLSTLKYQEKNNIYFNLNELFSKSIEIIHQLI